MNFEQALFEYSLTDAEELKSPATFVIAFKGGYATLEAPWYFKDKEGTIETVKRAWEKYCNNNQTKLSSITSINIVYKDKKEKKAINRRISA